VKLPLALQPLVHPKRRRAAEDYDTGFVCNAYGQWFADKDVRRWDTKWTEPDDQGDRSVLEIRHECPVWGGPKLRPNRVPFEGNLASKAVTL